jgi:hypothetical protein
MAPGLVQVFQKYRDRQVTFLSLTNMSAEAVEQFVVKFSIPWPSGYGATLQTIAAFGALNGAGRIPGYEVAPTLYLVGSDGRIRWSDRSARQKHLSTDTILADLDKAIAQALGEMPLH